MKMCLCEMFSFFSFVFVWCLCVYNTPESTQCCGFFPCPRPMMSASLQLRRCFQTLSATETSEPLCNPLSSCPSVLVVKCLSSLSFTCSSHPSLPWGGLAGSALLSVGFGLCAQCSGLLQTSSGGHFPPGSPQWGPVTTPVFWMLFLDVLESALKGKLCVHLVESIEMRQD